MEGNTLNEWDLDWFKIWPDAEHLSDWRMPKSKPGTFVHGAIIMENGDLVFNYEHLGMVRLNPKGNVMWRVPSQTHHSLHRAEN